MLSEAEETAVEGEYTYSPHTISLLFLHWAEHTHMARLPMHAPSAHMPSSSAQVMFSLIMHILLQIWTSSLSFTPICRVCGWPTDAGFFFFFPHFFFLPFTHIYVQTHRHTYKYNLFNPISPIAVGCFWNLSLLLFIANVNSTCQLNIQWSLSIY